MNEARRRLSVVSDNKLVEGLGDVNLNDDEAAEVCVLFDQNILSI